MKARGSATGVPLAFEASKGNPVATAPGSDLLPHQSILIKNGNSAST
jgi:hypothetical protein